MSQKDDLKVSQCNACHRIRITHNMGPRDLVTRAVSPLPALSSLLSGLY